MNHESPYYSHNGIAVYLGNCIEVMATMPAESIDFVLTDPPYLVNYTGRWDGDRKAIVGDDDADWLYPAFSEIYRLMKPDTFCLSFYGWPHCELFASAWKAIGFRLVSHIVFVKNVWGLGKMTRGQHETSFLLAKGKPKPFGKPISDVVEWTREQNAIHPNQKPLDALYPILSCYAPESALVLDPFMGSGSTLRAAKDMGMKAIGIEIEEQYCAGAVRRLAWRGAVLENTAWPFRKKTNRVNAADLIQAVGRVIGAAREHERECTRITHNALLQHAIVCFETALGRPTTEDEDHAIVITFYAPPPERPEIPF